MLYQHYTLRTQDLCIVLAVYTHIQTEDASVGVCHIGHVGHLNTSMDYPHFAHFCLLVGCLLASTLSAVTLVSQELIAVQWRSLSQTGCEVLSAHCVPAPYGCCCLPCDITSKPSTMFIKLSVTVTCLWWPIRVRRLHAQNSQSDACFAVSTLLSLPIFSNEWCNGGFHRNSMRCCYQ